MQKQISAVGILGIVLVSLALVIGIGYGVFAITRGSANEGNQEVASQVAYVSESWKDTYNDTEVTGGQVLTLFNEIESKNISVFLNTRGMRKSTIDVSSSTPVLMHNGKYYINYGVVYDYTDDSYKYVDSSETLSSNSNLFEVRDTSSLKVSYLPKLLNGRVIKNSDYTGVYTVGAPNYVDLHAKYDSNLIYDVNGNVSGVILSQSNKAGFNTYSLSTGTGGGSSTGGSVSGGSGSSVNNWGNASGNIPLTPNSGGSNSNQGSTPDNDEVGGGSGGSGSVPDNDEIGGGSDTDVTIPEEKPAEPSPESWFTVNSYGNQITGFSEYWDGTPDIIFPTQINGISITSIGQKAFQKAEIKSIVVPGSIKEIKDTAFNQSSLESVTLESGVTTLGSSAFSVCKNLKDVNLSDTLAYISTYCFSNCDSLESIVVPNSVTQMGYSCFNYCSALRDVTLSNQLVEIPNSCFHSCASLTNVNIPSSVKTIGYSAYYGCKGLENVSIPEGVEKLEERVFQNCGSLDYVKLPSTLNFIGEPVFMMTKVKSIEVSDDSPYYCVQDNALFTKDMTEILCYATASSATSFTIPSTVKKIWWSAFSGSSYLRGNLIIPDSVTSIGWSAFSSCSFTSVYLPHNITEIPQSCFASSNISYVYIPKSVTVIANNAFGYVNLSKIYFEGSSSQWNKIDIDSVAHSSDKLLSSFPRSYYARW